MNRPKLAAGLLAFAVVTALVGCAAFTKPYGSAGPNQQWWIASVDDEDARDLAETVHRQRGWGWSSHFAQYSQDGTLRELFVGPIAYAGENRRTIDISYVIFAAEPVRGRLIFEATAEDGYQLSESWANERVYEVEMEKSYEFGKVTVPQFRVPTESIFVRWVTDGVVVVEPEE